MTILGAQLGNVDHEPGKKTINHIKALTEWIVQYQGSIWEILPVAHDEVPLSRGAFITAISFLQRGLPTVPPSLLDQPAPGLTSCSSRKV